MNLATDDMPFNESSADVMDSLSEQLAWTRASTPDSHLSSDVQHGESSNINHRITNSYLAEHTSTLTSISQ